MKLTLKKLESHNPCPEGLDWFKAQKESDVKKICRALIADKRADWANWLIVRCLNRKQKIQYAVYAAEQVIKLYEDKYLEDSRPRDAIKAAKTYLKSPTKKNRAAAYAAAYAAYAAAYAADAAARAAADAAARAAADAAARAAYAAARAAAYAAARAAAYAAAYAAYAAADAAADAAARAAADVAADAAAYAAEAVYVSMRTKTLNYGLKLLYGGKK